MVNAIRIHEYGGTDKMRWEPVEVGTPGPGQIRVKHRAVGFNYIDTYFRSGLYKFPSLPAILGSEASGDVVAVGDGVTELKVGDRIAYANPLGAYVEERVMPFERAVKLPDSVDYKTAAAMMLQGMTVRYLLRETYKVGPGTVMLLHAAAGGVGLIACQWAKHLGATIIGTVGDEEKAKLAKAHGCNYVINYRKEDFVARVKEITERQAVRRRLRFRRQGHVPRLARLHQAAGSVGVVRQLVRPGAAVRYRHPQHQGLALRDAADAVHLHRDATDPARQRQRTVRSGRARHRQDRSQPDVCAG